MSDFLLHREGDAPQEGTLRGVLALQESLRWRPGSTPASGFLIAAWDDAWLRAFLRAEGALEVAVGADGAVVGYAAVGPLRGFFELLEAPYRGRLTLEAGAQLGGQRYLLQVGVAASHRRRGVASALLRAVCASSPEGVLADVVVEPTRNDASLALFARAGFAPIGSLGVASYPGLGPHRTEVWAWTSAGR